MRATLELPDEKDTGSCLSSDSKTTTEAGNKLEDTEALDDLIDKSSLYSPDALTKRISQWLKAPTSSAKCRVECDTQSRTFDSVRFPPTVHERPQTASAPSFSENVAGVANLPHALSCNPGPCGNAQLPSHQQTPVCSYTTKVAPDNSLWNQDLRVAPENAPTQQQTPSFADEKLEDVDANVRKGFPANNDLWPHSRPRGR